MAEIIEIDEFEPAFPVASSERDEALRRFSTLFLDKSHPRRYGSNGVVNKAQNAFGEIFAVKRLRAGLDETPLPDIPPSRASSGAIAAFRNEYESQLAVSNMKGFPRLYGFGTVDADPLIVMEWIEGTSLAELLERSAEDPNGRLAPSDVFAIGAELFSILANLDALSSRPVHRDLSPSNVIIRTSARPLSGQTASGEFDICIIDFGSTTLIDEQNPTFTATTNILRHATPEYAPPEMLTETLPNIMELRQSPAIDVYAVCSILYQALTGHTPYRISEHPAEVPYLLKTQSPPSPLEIPGYERACNAIMRGLSQDQAQRPSALQMRDVLLEACGRRPEGGPSPSGEPQVIIQDRSPLPTLTRAQGGASVREASFAHAADPSANEAASRGAHAPAISRRGFLTLAGAGAALLLVGGFGVSFLGSNKEEAPEEDSDEEANPIEVATYTGGTLYSAQDPATKLWGYLNAQRQWAIPPSFKNVPGLFVDGMALIKDQYTNEYGYINEKGEWAIEPKYHSANMFGEGLAFVQAPSGEEGSPLAGWIDQKGEWAIKPAYYGGGVFSNGLATFKTSDTTTSRWGYLNEKGEHVIDEQFFDAGAFADNGLAPASLHVSLYGWIDKTGAFAIEPHYARVQSFSEGLAGYMETFSEKWGYIDSSGNEVMPPIFLSVRRFKGGVAACKDADTQLWGFIDPNGDWAIEPQFQRAGDFAHGLAPAQDAASGNFGYIDDTGYWVIPPQYSDVNLNVME